MWFPPSVSRSTLIPATQKTPRSSHKRGRDSFCRWRQLLAESVGTALIEGPISMSGFEATGSKRDAENGGGVYAPFKRTRQPGDSLAFVMFPQIYKGVRHPHSVTSTRDPFYFFFFFFFFGTGCYDDNSRKTSCSLLFCSWCYTDRKADNTRD